MSSITIKRDDKTNIVVQVVTPEESNKIISAEDAEMDIRASEAVKAAISKAKICKKPIAKYDVVKKRHI